MKTQDEIIECFDNAWRALAKSYQNSPDETLRNAMNLLSRIIGEVKIELKKSAPEQLTIDDWILMLNESIENDW